MGAWATYHPLFSIGSGIKESVNPWQATQKQQTRSLQLAHQVEVLLNGISVTDAVSSRDPIIGSDFPNLPEWVKQPAPNR